MGRAVRVGVIGAGGVANAAHIPGYKELGGQVELVAVADVSREAAERTARQHGFARIYESYEEMLRQEELDCVSVCTPNRYHAPAVLAALGAGVHVLCEKPPAITVEEAVRMKEAAERSGKILAFGFHFRFHPEVAAAKRFAEEGALGEIYDGRITAMRRRGIPGWGVFTNKELQGGGPLIDIGVHMLDAALWVMGYPEPETVFGVTHTKLGDKDPGAANWPWGRWDWQHYTVEDVADALIRFRNGASLLLESSFIVNMEPLEETNVRLYGTQAGVRLFPFGVFRYEHDTLTNTASPWLPKPNAYHDEIAHFVAAVQGRVPPRPLAGPGTPSSSPRTSTPRRSG